jgi:hypothetical protein
MPAQQKIANSQPSKSATHLHTRPLRSHLRIGFPPGGSDCAEKSWWAPVYFTCPGCADWLSIMQRLPDCSLIVFLFHYLSSADRFSQTCARHNNTTTPYTFSEANMCQLFVSLHTRMFYSHCRLGTGTQCVNGYRLRKHREV